MGRWAYADVEPELSSRLRQQVLSPHRHGAELVADLDHEGHRDLAGTVHESTPHICPSPPASGYARSPGTSTTHAGPVARTRVVLRHIVAGTGQPRPVTGEDCAEVAGRCGFDAAPVPLRGLRRVDRAERLVLTLDRDPVSLSPTDRGDSEDCETDERLL